MNWCDLAVLAIILAFAIVGLTRGFIFTIFRLFSFFASIIISIKLYPVMASVLMKTALFTSIKHSIFINLMKQSPSLVTQADGAAKQAAAGSVINHLKLPEFFKQTLIAKLPNPSQFLDVSKIMDMVSNELASVVISIISLVLIYILVRIGLAFLQTLLKGIAKLPVFKQMDKLGGFAFGALEGLLTIYIVFSVLMLFNANPAFKTVFDALDASVLAKYFYQNNFIISWAFPAA